MILPLFNTNFISIGPIHIKWYSLAYIAGIIIAWLLIKYYNTKYELHLYNKENESNFCDDFFFYGILGIVLGGRLGYVIFYNINYYLHNLFDIFAIWSGGMSFHGGLIGVIIATILLCKKYNINKLLFLDVLTVVVPIGLFFGRLANFINLELYGRPTTVPWGMVFPTADNLARHPSQLYEALLEGVVLFIIMNLLVHFKKFKKIGLNSSLFLMLYSSFRIFVEYFREPDAQLGFIFKYLTMGQVLSVPLFVCGVIILVKNYRKNIK
ncbi:MAG: prolipoprotein diacylglyceryl transferase [Rickettsiales bacterium]|nr:prolipoprotein diacylglyceryl transferase [Rickettsiales bacterium]